LVIFVTVFLADFLTDEGGDLADFLAETDFFFLEGEASSSSSVSSSETTPDRESFLMLLKPLPRK
jgi:hypothetical protein